MTAELQKVEQTQLNTVQATGGLSPMVQAVMSGQMTAEQLQSLLNVQKDYEKNEAEKAFHLAVAEFKKDPPDVFKDKHNKQFDSKYASKGNLVNTVNAALSPFGLNANWDFDQRDDGKIGVTCILSHAQGHSKKVTLWAPPDKSGAKNPIQEIKSTITYLEIATYEAVTGIAASDAGDDDGNGSGDGKKTISEKQVADLEALITEVGAVKSGFLRAMGVTDLSQIQTKYYAKGVKALEAKRNQQGTDK